ncbi:hypothetical protein [Micromonospora pisi]|uniref:hypothetical protein n=1 Tax=Micromonospora pisi TaxID=589240 RepID=UPI0011C397E9|nr:hypothetical protein [Micromonospora pisi]
MIRATAGTGLRRAPGRAPQKAPPGRARQETTVRPRAERGAEEVRLRVEAIDDADPRGCGDARTGTGG